MINRKRKKHYQAVLNEFSTLLDLYYREFKKYRDYSKIATMYLGLLSIYVGVSFYLLHVFMPAKLLSFYFWIIAMLFGFLPLLGLLSFTFFVFLSINSNVLMDYRISFFRELADKVDTFKYYKDVNNAQFKEVYKERLLDTICYNEHCNQRHQRTLAFGKNLFVACSVQLLIFMIVVLSFMCFYIY